MKLYEEIIFLKHWCKKSYLVENVRSYYEPLIKPQEITKHYFWSNFVIKKWNGKRKVVYNAVGQTTDVKMKSKKMFVRDWYGFKGDKRAIINNAIEDKLGKHILKCVLKK